MMRTIIFLFLSFSVVLSSQLQPVQIHHLNDLYHKDLFQPDTWILFDIESGNKQSNENFIKNIRKYSDPDSFSNPRSTKFFVIGTTPKIQKDLSLENNITGVLDFDDTTALTEKLKNLPKPKRIIIASASSEDLQKMRDTLANIEALRGANILLYHVMLPIMQQTKLAAGVFLYTKCPQSPAQYCAVLVDRNYGGNKDTFSNPGGLVDEGETPDMAAAREATEELGGFIQLRKDDLHTDYRNPNVTLHLSGVNQSDAGFGQIEYHMFFKEISASSASEILRAIQSSSGHGSGESNAVAIVPIEDLRDQMSIKVGNGSTYAHRNGTNDETVRIRLFPQMITLLKQPIHTKSGTMTFLEFIKKHLEHKIDLDSDKHEEQFATAIAQKAQTSAEIKYQSNKLSKLQKKPSDAENKLASLPFTATQAYTVVSQNLPTDTEPAVIRAKFEEYYKKQLENFKNTPNKEELLKKALELYDTETKHKGWYVFYHGTTEKMAFLYDVLSEYRQQLELVTQQKNPRLRFLDSPFIGLENVHDFIKFFTSNGAVDNYLINHRNTLPSGTTDSKSYQDMGLSATSYFSDISFLEYFARNHTSSPPDYQRLYNAVKTTFNFGKTWSDYEELFDHYKKDSGRLYQIFISPDVIDQISYLAKAGGPVLLFKGQNDQETYSTDQAITKLRTDPTASYPIIKNSQVRIFMKPSIFNNPNVVRIRYVDNLSPESEEQALSRTKAIRDYVRSDIQKMIQDRTLTVADGNALGRLNRYIQGSHASRQIKQNNSVVAYQKFKSLVANSDLQGLDTFLKRYTESYPIESLIPEDIYNNTDNDSLLFTIIISCSEEKIPDLIGILTKYHMLNDPVKDKLLKDITKNDNLTLLKRLFTESELIARSNQADIYQHWTSINLALNHNSNKIALYLLSLPGVNLDHRDVIKRRYLDYATSLEVVQYLIENKGQKIFTPDQIYLLFQHAPLDVVKYVVKSPQFKAEKGQEHLTSILNQNMPILIATGKYDTLRFLICESGYATSIPSQDKKQLIDTYKQMLEMSQYKPTADVHACILKNLGGSDTD